MKKSTLYIALFVLCSLSTTAQLLPNLGGQRTGSSALTFLKNDGSARSLGMASANLTLKGDASTAFTNVANISSIESFSLGISNYFVGAGINQSFLAAVLPFKDKNSTFSLTVNSLSSGKQEVRTEFQPKGTGEYFYVANTAVGLGYALELSDQFAFGIKLKYINEQLAQYQNHTVGADLGFIYNTDIKELSFAVGVTNFGGNTALNGDHQELKFNNNTTPTPEKFTIPTEFKIGISVVPLDKNDHKIGGEYSYKNLLYGRLGIILGRKNQRIPTLGLGMKMIVKNHPVRINYAFLPTSFVGLQHSLGINFQFYKMEDRSIENE
jgi:hypothetical protein